MLKAVINDIEEAGAAAEFYVEKDGKYELQVEGMKTEGDIERLQRALANEREAHKSTKEGFSWVGELSAAEVQELRDAREDLTYQLENAPKQDEAMIEERAERLAARQTRGLERQLAEIQAERDAHLNAISLHEAAQGQRLIKDSVEAALSGSDALKLAEGAIADVVPFAERVMEVRDGRVVAREGIEGVDPGASFTDVLADIQASGRRKHWFPASTGAGAQGGDAAGNLAGNPFAGENRNMTEIGRLIKADPNKARALAKAAGDNPARYGL